MGKNVIKNIDKIKKERKMSVEIISKVKDRIIVNSAIYISFIIMIIAYIIAEKNLQEKIANTIYNVFSFIFLLCSIITFEIGYKKNNGSFAVSGIELLVISIFTLFAPYLFFKFNVKITYIFMGIMLLYYILKIIIIYRLEKRNYLKKIDDISNIIKKESKDELLKEYESKMQNKEAKRKTASKKTTSSNRKKSKGKTAIPTKSTTKKINVNKENK